MTGMMLMIPTILICLTCLVISVVFIDKNIKITIAFLTVGTMFLVFMAMAWYHLIWLGAE